MKLDKVKNGVFIFLGICILVAGEMISDGLITIAERSVHMDDTSIGNNESYELVVQDGFLYLTDTISGTVWKKADNPEAKWKELDYIYND